MKQAFIAAKFSNLTIHLLRVENMAFVKLIRMYGPKTNMRI